MSTEHEHAKFRENPFLWILKRQIKDHRSIERKHMKEEERDDFDAWIRKRNPDISLKRYADGRYRVTTVNYAWEAYQAGRAALQSQTLCVDALAQEIRRVDGSHSLGAGALSEALMPFIQSALQSQDRADSGKLQEAARDMFVRASEIEVLYGTNKETEGLVMAAIRMAYLVGPIDEAIDRARRIEGDGE